ncbi:MAG: protein kinase, partial [Deltaproteobacteria bacterium]|nr:protein kinase [Deltaproteobacteria bacterium]
MLAPTHLEAGQVLARDFRVLKPLAAGGMGSVYLVEQLSTGRQRALKVMHPQLARDAESRGRFQQEARVGARIRSEHVVEVVSAGIDDDTGIPWLAMELLDGEELAQRMKRQGRLAPDEVLEVFRQLCHGLGEAHRAGLVHRDLKPENIFIATSRRQDVPFTVKILDFGVAKLVQEVQGGGDGTRPVGTPRWMAPEQSDTTAHILPATDVWALGLIAFHLLTGRSYWRAIERGANFTALMRELVFEPIESASERATELQLAPALPAGFDAWFARCVVREQEKRYPDATAALAGLEPLLKNAHFWGGDPATTSDPLFLARNQPPDEGANEATLGGPAAAATRQGRAPTPANRGTGPSQLPIDPDAMTSNEDMLPTDQAMARVPLPKKAPTASGTQSFAKPLPAQAPPMPVQGRSPTAPQRAPTAPPGRSPTMPQRPPTGAGRSPTGAGRSPTGAGRSPTGPARPPEP